mmetsp:Transcript_2051/g.2960  ORF Transcript_2051/g.2960 Transcript_2051/m.2960 type:complete len:90 (-) Transcript_2051:556-825(-)
MISNVGSKSNLNLSKNRHIAIPQHTITSIYTHNGKEKPQRITKPNKQRQLPKAPPFIPPVKAKAQQINNSPVHDLPIHRNAHASYNQRR